MSVCVCMGEREGEKEREIEIEWNVLDAVLCCPDAGPFISPADGSKLSCFLGLLQAKTQLSKVLIPPREWSASNACSVWGGGDISCPQSGHLNFEGPSQLHNSLWDPLKSLL